MGSTTDKVKGATNEAIGKAKQGIGEAVGSDKLQGEGAIQEIKGKGQQALGDAKEATKDASRQGRRRGQQEPLIGACGLGRPARWAGLFFAASASPGETPPPRPSPASGEGMAAALLRTSAQRWLGQNLALDRKKSIRHLAANAVSPLSRLRGRVGVGSRKR